ncbi:MAG: hypothetical protein AAF636_10665, partial [Pseudomonadota bacterium]
LDTNPGYFWIDLISRIASMYEITRMYINPLQGFMRFSLTLKKVADVQDLGTFISANGVETGGRVP